MLECSQYLKKWSQTLNLKILHSSSILPAGYHELVPHMAHLYHGSLYYSGRTVNILKLPLLNNVSTACPSFYQIAVIACVCWVQDSPRF